MANMSRSRKRSDYEECWPCGLEYSITPDLVECMREPMANKFTFVVVPIVHPRFRQQDVVDHSILSKFDTRSDMVISPQDWSLKVVGKISPYIDVDAPDSTARNLHERYLDEELAYCKGLGLSALMLNIHSTKTLNLSSILRRYVNDSPHVIHLWVRVTMLCKKTQRKNPDDTCAAYDEPWLWWTTFHEQLEWNRHVGVVLELSADLPNAAVINRWLGEPIKAIVLPTSIFSTNKKGFPVLSHAHRKAVLSFVKQNAQIIFKGPLHFRMEDYITYIQLLFNKNEGDRDPMYYYAKGWEDYLQTPLQPLIDNLDTHTYNVFEKDPVKYDQYQKAIVQALLEKKKQYCDDKTNEVVKGLNDMIIIDDELKDCKTEVECSKKFTIMVLGAGRGPLVRAALNAADITKANVKIIAVEKNPCAVVVLNGMVRELWHDKDVEVVRGDMRHIKLSPKADIIVSELLGSWGDNELSPECLDGAAALMAPDGISIPKSYTSYVAPITSPRLWAAAKAVMDTKRQCDNEKNLETLWVVYMQNKYDIADTKPVFTFEHPAKGITDADGKELKNHQGVPLTDNKRMVTISWVAEQSCVMHGFGGYFDCTLYGSEKISIVPSTHSPGMISWFPVFIPIKTPMRVKKGEKIQATFWRCTCSRKVWYEWCVKVGNRSSIIHNTNGRCSEMLL